MPEDTEVKHLIAILVEKVERIEEDVQGLRHVMLEGNGQPSMMVRVALMESEQRRLQEERDDRKMPRAVWISILVSSFISAATLVYEILK